MTGRFAIDIETVSPSLNHYEKPPDFEDPQYFELLAVVLGYESSDGEQEAEMLFRTSSTPEAELDLVARTIDWLGEREGAPISRMVANSSTSHSSSDALKRQQ